MDIDAFVEKFQDLLNLENSPRSNVSASPPKFLRSLSINSVFTGEMGGTSVVVGRCDESILVAAGNTTTRVLADVGFDAGDEVELTSAGSGSTDQKSGDASRRDGRTATKVSGVITSVTSHSVTIILSSSSTSSSPFLSSLSPPLCLSERSSNYPSETMHKALEKLKEKGRAHEITGSVIRELFSTSPPSPPSQKASDIDIDTDNINSGGSSSSNSTFNSSLTPPQVKSIHLSMSRPLTLIHGPPGTGKTTTIVEIILRALHEKKWR